MKVTPNISVRVLIEIKRRFSKSKKEYETRKNTMKKALSEKHAEVGSRAIVLVGWSSVASAQWTGLANAFPSGFAQPASPMAR
jgi:hypothetical protein